MAKEWIVPDADIGCDGAYFGYQELVRCRDCKYSDTFCELFCAVAALHQLPDLFHCWHLIPPF